MKKYILATLLSFLYFLVALTPAQTLAKGEPAYGSYAYIPTSGVYFYSDDPSPADRRGLFRLPYTYYVRVLSSDGEYYRVEYLTDGASTKKLVGYCKKTEVIPVDYVPELPYLYLTVKITYTLDGDAGKDADFSAIVVTCAYYGDYDDGTRTYSYILREDTFGYVEKPVGLVYDLNDEYERRTKPQTPSASSSETAKASVKPAQIAVLVLLCLLIPAIAALILHPPGRPPYETEE